MKVSKPAAKKSKTRLEDGLGPSPIQIAAMWPHDSMPLVMWGSHSDIAVIPTAIKAIKFSSFCDFKLDDLNDTKPNIPKYIGMISYDEFSTQATQRAPSYIFEIHSCLIWKSGAREPDHIIVGNPDHCPLKLTKNDLKTLFKLAIDFEGVSTKGSIIHPTLSDESYLACVSDIIQKIRSGTFYQLNFLRYFRVVKSWNWHQVCSRLQEHGGQFSSLLKVGNTVVVSLSPERFVSINGAPRERVISTWPIKGTSDRKNDDSSDKESSKNLGDSKKDHAELNMIIDLMRNDLHRICKPLGVEVTDPGTVVSHKHVHHLQGHVEGRLKENISIGEVLKALCPGGSITGAPKIEVMQQIQSFEGRNRGYFMGNSILINTDGTWDSNILIRTLVSTNAGKSWDYAAGSGIVIKSTPEEERLEVLAKCRPITD